MQVKTYSKRVKRVKDAVIVASRDYGYKFDTWHVNVIPELESALNDLFNGIDGSRFRYRIALQLAMKTCDRQCEHQLHAWHYLYDMRIESYDAGNI